MEIVMCIDILSLTLPCAMSERYIDQNLNHTVYQFPADDYKNTLSKYAYHYSEDSLFALITLLFNFLGSTWFIGLRRKTWVLSHNMMQTISADYLGMFSYLPAFLADNY